MMNRHKVTDNSLQSCVLNVCTQNRQPSCCPKCLRLSSFNAGRISRCAAVATVQVRKMNSCQRDSARFGENFGLGCPLGNSCGVLTLRVRILATFVHFPGGRAFGSYMFRHVVSPPALPSRSRCRCSLVHMWETGECNMYGTRHGHVQPDPDVSC